MPTTHLEFGGSTAARTLACPAWHALAKTLPPPPESEAAKLGSALHAAAEAVLIGEMRPGDAVGKTYEGVVITQAMVDDKLLPAVLAAGDMIDANPGGDYEVEGMVMREPDVGGTADLLMLNASKTRLTVADFKFGDGVLVDAADNAQLMHYAMCALNTPGWKDDLTEIDDVRLMIIQPTERRDGLVTTDIIPAEKLYEFEHAYVTQVRRARAYMASDTLPPAGEYKAGPHCRFCPASAICPVKTGAVEHATRLTPNNAKELAYCMGLADALESWIRNVRKLAHEQMERGDTIEGYKLVAKRATRSWTSEDDVLQLVKNLRKLKATDAMKHTLLSPAQLEKVCKQHNVDWVKFEPYIQSRSTGTTVVPESDSRPRAPAVAALKALAERSA